MRGRNPSGYTRLDPWTVRKAGKPAPRRPAANGTVRGGVVADDCSRAIRAGPVRGSTGITGFSPCHAAKPARIIDANSAAVIKPIFQ